MEIAKAYDAGWCRRSGISGYYGFFAMQRDTVVDMVRKVAENVFIPFTVGGGIRTVDDFKSAASAKVQTKFPSILLRLTIPELIREAADKFGSQCVVVAIDAKRRADGGWNIYKHGGRIGCGNGCS